MVRGMDRDASTEEFLLIIKAVEKRPGLYHRFDSINSPEARFEAWNEVAKETNLPAVTCRDRWRYCRQVFVKYLRKEKLGMAAKILLGNLHFLNSHIVLKKPPIAMRSAKDRIATSNITSNDMDESGAELRNVTLEAVEFLNNYNENNSNEEAVDTLKMEQIDTDNPEDDIHSNNESEPPSPKYVQPASSANFGKQQILNDDIDLSFLKSMLPEMKLMNDRQKSLFKAKVINVAIEILYGSNANN